MEQQQQAQQLIQNKRQFYYQSFKSAERDGAKKAGVGGMKGYLKHNNNQNMIPSPRSDFSGGAMSNFSSTSELKCKVNASIKMKTPNQTCGPPNMQFDNSSILDSAQKFEHFSNTQQSVLLSPSMNYKTIGGKTPQNRQPSQIVNVSGGRTPGTNQDNQQFRRFHNPSSQGYSMTSPPRQSIPGVGNKVTNNGQIIGNTASLSSAAPQQQNNSSNIQNTSKHESSVNLSSKVLSNELKGSIREDEPRDSWNQIDRSGNNLGRPHFGGAINTILNGRKTTGMPTYLSQKAAKMNGMSGTPQISRNTKRPQNDHQNIILDSDHEMDGANMDDTEEHDSLNPKNQKRMVHSTKGQGRKNQDKRLNFYKSVKHLNPDPEEDDCDVADEDIQINSLSCERQTVNSQGVLSMKDFQSLSKRNIFQRKMNKSQQTHRAQQRNTVHLHGMINNTSLDQHASPFRGANFLNDNNGPVIGRPSNYAEKRIKRTKEQQQSLFKQNKDLYLNKYCDPSTQIESSSIDQPSKDHKSKNQYDIVISNSSQKPDMAQSFQPYNNGTFSNTYDNKKSPVGQLPLNIMNDDNKSRQSMNNLNTFNSSKSNQFTNTQQSNRLIDEQVINQNTKNQSAQKAKPSFRPSKAGTEQVHPFASPSNLKQSMLNSDSNKQPKRDQIQAHTQRHNQRSQLGNDNRQSMAQQMQKSSESNSHSLLNQVGGLNGNNLIHRNKKTKAGVVSPQNLLTNMQCHCDVVDRNKQNHRTSDKLQMGHKRQASKTKEQKDQQTLLTSQTDEDYNVSLTQSVSEIDKVDSARNPRICGKYCKNLTPEQEKQIILECLRESIEKHFENLQGKAYEEFKSSIISEVENGLNKYSAQHFQSMNMINAQENDKRYLISAQWWREWQDYTNFDLSQLQLHSQSQVQQGSFTNKNKSYIGVSTQNNQSEKSSQVTISQRKKSDSEGLEIQYKNQNIVLKMDPKNKTQDLTQVKEYTQESSFQQIQMSTQKDNEYYNTTKLNTKSLNYQERMTKQAIRMESLMLQIKRSPMDSIESSLTMKSPAFYNGNTQKMNQNQKMKKKQQNQKVSVENSVEHKSKKHHSNKYHKELSFRQGSSIADMVDNESQFSVKDSVRQRHHDFNKELQLLKQQQKKAAQQQYNGMNPNDDGNHFDLANEQDSIAINSDSLGSDRRYSKKRWHDKEMISQSSATFVNKQTTGGYYRPDKIKNVDLLKDPSLLKEQMAQNQMKNGNASPNSIAVGRKLMGGPGNSTHSMNHVYFNLKDDLIEHFDYEAVNHQVFQYLLAWYGVDIQVMRFIKRDNVNKEELYLELYPEKRLANNHFQQQNSGQKNKQSLRGNHGKHLTPSQIDYNFKDMMKKSNHLGVPEQTRGSAHSHRDQVNGLRSQMHRLKKQ